MGVVALLGVIKAGGFYFALDPGFPAARIRTLIEDARARIVLTDARGLNLMHSVALENIFVMDIDQMPRDLPAAEPAADITLDTICNLIYTSGSTGTPKGVIHTHRTLIHKAYQGVENYRFHPGDRLGMLAPFTYGNSHWHVFGALLNGGSVHPYDLKREGLAGTQKWLREHQITFTLITPTTLRQLVQTFVPGDGFPDLRLLNIGGESIRQSDIGLYKKFFGPSTTLCLSGGTTETMMVAECFLGHDYKPVSDEVPWGYVIPDKEVFIQNLDGRPVPEGEVGEVFVTSRFNSPGYWRQPEQTALVFQLDPNTGASTYRTGDLGKRRQDGVLVHCGRIDHQLKIRGYRVEPHEVEMALIRHPQIREAVVVGRPDPLGELALVAYLLPLGGAISISGVREFLAAELPDYLHPSRLMVLEAFPLTSSRKIDRRALPDPGMGREGIDTPFVSPRTDLERSLAAIWEKVLGVSPVGLQDNFSELGGHSLLATMIANRIQDAFEIPLSVVDLLEAPTIAGIAAVIARMQEDSAQ